MHHDKARHQQSIEQIELPLPGTGEAPSGERSGEATSAAQGAGRSGLDGLQVMERIVEGGNVRRVFAAVDKWLHRRLRMLILKQQKRGTTLYRTFRARRLSRRWAAAAAAHCGRWWATAAHGALHTAFPTQYFFSIGVPRLGPS